MLGSSSITQLVKVVGPFVFILWTIWYMGISRQQVHEVARKFRAQRDLFITDFIEHEIDGKFDGGAITDLCTSRKWTPGLVMSCDALHGGIGFVRNAYLHCIRFAIEAGAELVLPSIFPRAEENLQDMGSRTPVPLDYFFDADHLHHVFSTYCPQLKTYESMNELYNVPEVANPVEFNIGDTNQDWVNGTLLANPGNWSRQFHAFLDSRVPLKDREYPLRVHLKHTVWVWPTANDTASVASSFGRILRIREDARRLAASALFTLALRFKLNLDPRTNYHPESFVGIHLRTEEGISDGLPDYLTQAADYFHFLAGSNTSVAYLASGATPSNITSFTERAEDFNVTVVTKRDILDDKELAVLDEFSWDQRGLVDYEIMLRAGLVAGVGGSSFAWNLALRRAYAFGSGPMAVPRPRAETIAWKDKFTTLYGRHEERTDAMRASIWP
ncbi:alternative oxidase [Colletotrichum plurivorum]|uniref:Alternative oxidase n=1 Tax=Colletotrichum plurivorum TaxID=2175906 RepID=A0A8H6K1C7_9PEZI|nr:alternative oxidase [Colletotrichum plurivorum]